MGINLSKSSLVSELLGTLNMIDKQIAELTTLAKTWRPEPISVQELRDVNGGYLMTPLLVAKASVLQALSNIQ